MKYQDKRPQTAFVAFCGLIASLFLVLNLLMSFPVAAHSAVTTINLSASVSNVQSHTLPGFKNYIMMGVSSDPSSASENWIQNTAPWDLRYQYLTGNVNDSHSNWTTWDAPSGQFATNYMARSANFNTIPVFSYYCMLNSGVGGDEGTADFTHLNNPSTMNNYYANFKLLLDKAKAFGRTTIIHVEPDLWGYMEAINLVALNSDDASKVTASVSNSGYGDVVNGLPNTVVGFAQALVRLRDKYAPNVLLAYHNSNWGSRTDVGLNSDPNTDLATVARHSANFFLSLNANFDLIFDDETDRDAAFYDQGSSGPHWWDTTNQRLPNFNQYAKYLSYLHQYTQKPLVEWQIPLGNTIMRSVNDTSQHWQDNKVQYFLGANYNQNLAAYANAGVVAFLFGSGNGETTDYLDGAGDGVTNPAPINGNNTTATVSDDDGGYLRQQGSLYYKAPYPLSGTPNPTPPPTGCTVNCVNRYNLPMVANHADNTTTYLTLQNMSGSRANITVQYYDNNSGNNGSQDTFQIAPNGQTAFLPNLASGQKANGIINSDQPLNVLLSESVATGGSAFSISSQTSSILYDPLAANNYLGFTTALTVFNAGNSSSSVNVQFYDQNGNVLNGASQNFNLPTHASQTLNQAGTALNSGQLYWAKITGASGSQLTAQVTESDPTIQFTATFNALSQAAATLYAPAIFKGAYGFNTGLAVANPNASQANLSVNYYDTAGNSVASQTAIVPANGTWSVFQGGLANLPANFNGSAKISSSQPLIAVVNENGGGSKSGSYTALSKGSQKIGLPVMAAGAYGGYFTGTTLLNVSSNPVNLAFQYVDANGNTVGSKSFTIGPNASFQLYQGNTDAVAGPVLMMGFFGTAQISSNLADSLVATTNAISGSLFYTYTEPSF